MKLWEKNVQINAEIERFTIGRDREMDLYLAQDDVLGSMAHITMLESIGLLEADELKALLAQLRQIHADIQAVNFVIEEGGTVVSNIKAETKPWTNWKIFNGKLLLNKDTFDVVTLGADSLAIENRNGIFVYKRQLAK